MALHFFPNKSQWCQRPQKPPNLVPFLLWSHLPFPPPSLVPSALAHGPLHGSLNLGHAPPKVLCTCSFLWVECFSPTTPWLPYTSGTFSMKTSWTASYNSNTSPQSPLSNIYTHIISSQPYYFFLFFFHLFFLFGGRLGKEWKWGVFFLSFSNVKLGGQEFLSLLFTMKSFKTVSNT